MKETRKEPSPAPSGQGDLLAAPAPEQEMGEKSLPTHPEQDSLGRRKSSQQQQQFAAETDSLGRRKGSNQTRKFSAETAAKTGRDKRSA
ncbi:MAG: hypothetical protein ACLQJR_05850 [Stellaceae bacterium]